MAQQDTSFLDPEARAILDAMLRDNKPYDGKFSSKLTERERCAILAVSLYGITRPVVAAAFGIDRRTVTHITNPNSLHYREVRAEHKRLGHQDFLKEYLTPDVMKRVNDAFRNPDVNKSGMEIRADHAAKKAVQVRLEGPNEHSNKWEGRNSLKLQQHNNDTYVVWIRWVPDHPSGEGWWVYEKEDDTAAVLGPFNTSEQAKRTTEQEHYWMG